MQCPYRVLRCSNLIKVVVSVEGEEGGIITLPILLLMIVCRYDMLAVMAGRLMSRVLVVVTVGGEAAQLHPKG